MRITELNPRTKRIQSGLKEGLFLSGRFSYIGFGPPHIHSFGLNSRPAVSVGVNLDLGPLGSLNAELGVGQASSSGVDLDDEGGSALVFPAGLVQSVGLAQNANQPRLFEIGTDRHYTLRGRSLGQIGISAIEFDGPSLLRKVYAAYGDESRGGNIPPLFPNDYYDNDADIPGEGGVANHPTQLTPGYQNGWINMASDVFERPAGALLVLKDSAMQVHTAVYAESCHIPSHNLRWDAAGTVITSGISLQYERLVPVRVAPVRQLTSTFR
jgi:hypothetical protein